MLSSCHRGFFGRSAAKCQPYPKIFIRISWLYHFEDLQLTSRSRNTNNSPKRLLNFFNFPLKFSFHFKLIYFSGSVIHFVLRS